MRQPLRTTGSLTVDQEDTTISSFIIHITTTSTSNPQGKCCTLRTKMSRADVQYASKRMEPRAALKDLHASNKATYLAPVTSAEQGKLIRRRPILENP